METTNLLGRYEKDKVYAIFKQTSEGYTYEYGTTGFWNSTKKDITEDELKTYVQGLMQDGFVKTDETPIAEQSTKEVNEFLDWIGGIRR